DHLLRRVHRQRAIVRLLAMTALVHRVAELPRGKAADIEDPFTAGYQIGAILEPRVLLRALDAIGELDHLREHAEDLQNGVSRGLRKMRPDECLRDYHGAPTPRLEA